MTKNVSATVKRIVADHLGIDEQKVTDESSFIDDLGADSLDTVELVWLLKKSFCLLYTSPSPRDGLLSRMPSSA